MSIEKHSVVRLQAALNSADSARVHSPKLYFHVIAGPVPAIDDSLAARIDVNGRHKAGHDTKLASLHIPDNANRVTQALHSLP